MNYIQSNNQLAIEHFSSIDGVVLTLDGNRLVVSGGQFDQMSGRQFSRYLRENYLALIFRGANGRPALTSLAGMYGGRRTLQTVRVFHGTTPAGAANILENGFSAFLVGSNTRSSDTGFYFSTSIEVARQYGYMVLECEISFYAAVESDFEGGHFDRDAVQDEIDQIGYGRQFDAVILRNINDLPEPGQMGDYDELGNFTPSIAGASFRPHHGILADTYIVFSPAQVRILATHNLKRV